MSKPKLAVIYRACPLEYGSNPVKEYRPKDFCKLINFLSIYNNHKQDPYFDISIHVVFDGEKRQYIFKDFSDVHNLIFTINRGNLNSYLRCINYASLLNSNGIQNEKYDLFYFLEDDYLHKPSWSKVLFDGYELAKRDKNTIITLYDHPDRYTRNDDIDYVMDIILGNNYHWRTSESTTCTYAVTSEDYSQIFDVAKYYNINDREFFRNIILWHNFKLITPIPAPSTHLHIPYISPFFDAR